MGFWRNNPTEPCCNPPAGFCQCQPCRWKVTFATSGVWEVVYKNEITNQYEPFDHWAVVGVPQSLYAWTSAAQLHKYRVPSGTTPPLTIERAPWRRLWRSLVQYPERIGQYVLADPEHNNSVAYVFGYYDWAVESGGAFTGSAAIVRTWGFGLEDRTGKTLNPLPYLESTIRRPAMYWWVAGHNVEGWESSWNCWGRNKLIYVDPEEGYDPTKAIIVEPDL